MLSANLTWKYNNHCNIANLVTTPPALAPQRRPLASGLAAAGASLPHPAGRRRRRGACAGIIPIRRPDHTTSPHQSRPMCGKDEYEVGRNIIMHYEVL